MSGRSQCVRAPFAPCIIVAPTLACRQCVSPSVPPSVPHSVSPSVSPAVSPSMPATPTWRHTEGEAHSLAVSMVGVLPDDDHAHLVQRAAVERPAQPV